LLTLFFNVLIPQINFDELVWKPPIIFDRGQTVGMDFRSGLYQQAKVILSGQTPQGNYPPLTDILAIPLIIVSETRAYQLFVVILCLTNLAVIFLSLHIALDVFGDSTGLSKQIAFGLLFLIPFLHFSSYGFLFSIERGNYDILAIFFSILGLWLLITHPKQLFLQVVCISLAANLKVYPAILFILLIWKHGGKSLLLIAAINAVFLLLLGPGYLGYYFRLMTNYIQTPYLWVGNHSSTSFIQYLGLNPQNIGSWLIKVVPVLFFVASSWLVIRKGYTKQNAVWLFLISIPLMNVIPTVAHDYKLVILAPILIILLYELVIKFAKNGLKSNLIFVICLLGIFFFISRSYIFLPWPLQNKWPFIILLQIFMLIFLVTSEWISQGSLRPGLEDKVNAFNEKNSSHP
jgi:hypothetical protein